eukprot:TRINITY_DN68057_c0_g1_i1.p1 TRINITY_DN68057_c0_g1~~TRINITY_DN68057_c0_g1_i1.p1  ORF type:complete len:168 (+),score=58.78 TRINITY_DN68057_c0_g1_i1:63-506(+)
MAKSLALPAAAMLALLCVCVSGQDTDPVTEEEFFGNNEDADPVYDPEDPNWESENCQACNSAFDYIDMQLKKPWGTISDEMLEAEIMDSKPCQWAVGSTQGKCYTIVEELDDAGAISTYISGRKASGSARIANCQKWCKEAHGFKYK